MKKASLWAGVVAVAAWTVMTSGQGLPPGPMPTPTVNGRVRRTRFDGSKVVVVSSQYQPSLQTLKQTA
jgi:hypothetical protein